MVEPEKKVTICKCPYCDVEIEEASAMCVACMTVIIECVNCGKPVRKESEACPNCGEPIPKEGS